MGGDGIGEGLLNGCDGRTFLPTGAYFGVQGPVGLDGTTPGSGGADDTVSSQEPSGGLLERGGAVTLRPGEEADT